MADPLISMAFDDTSMGIISKMEDFGEIFDTSMGSAMSSIGEMIASAAQQNTTSAFQNPTGRLAGSITAEGQGPSEEDVTVDVPYARRLEFGFDATDSLGRKYNEAPEPYLEPAIESSSDGIVGLLGTAALESWASLA